MLYLLKRQTFLQNRTLELAKENQVVVVTDDRDITVMLLHHWKEDLKDISFMSENKSIEDAQWRFD